MKILCIGRKGNNRSVALAFLLKERGHDAIAVGMRRMRPDTRKMMMDWAELIVVLHVKCCEGVPQEYMKKTKILTTSSSEHYQITDGYLLKHLEDFIKKEKL